MRSTFQSLICNREFLTYKFIPSPSSSILRLVRSGHPELGEEVLEGGEGGGLAPVVLVAVHVEHLLPGHGEHAGENALGEAGAQDNAVIGLIHDEDNVNTDLKTNEICRLSTTLV